MSTVSGIVPKRSQKEPQKIRRHVLDLDDFSHDELYAVLRLADTMQEVQQRDIKKVPTLRGKTIFTLFYEDSTRTRASFEQAAKILSADVINIRADASSVNKGESLLNTSLTLQAMGADIIVVRHPQSGAPYLMVRSLSTTSVINGGDGRHAHPSQALLDLYTIWCHIGPLEGKKILLVGDILHSRVARSELWGLIKLGANVTVCGPPTLLPLDMLEKTKNKKDKGLLNKVTVETDLDKAIGGAEAIIALRLQKERHNGGLIPSIREYSQLWQVNEERLSRAVPQALVMHPGPMNEGIEISPYVAHGLQSHVEEQVSNGVAIRMALLYMLAGAPPAGDAS
jgi:aspartate carbamoyltransferase catalytic subunit